MNSGIFKIFGFNILFELDDSIESSVLMEELGCYPKSSSQDHDLIIQYEVKGAIADDELSSNPSSHTLYCDGFSMKTNNITARFIFDSSNLNKVIFSYNRGSGFIFKTVQKWSHIQFRHEREAIGQIVHEFILVPINFFLSNRAIIHASAVITQPGKLLMFGGTGGVGKTSLELELCRNHGCSFFADDICVADDSGNVFPNLSYPKIYGYNLINNDALRRELIRGYNLSDRVHWKLHSLRGLDKVRRRVSPFTIYKKVTRQAHLINGFFILNRTNVNLLEVKEIDNDFSSRLNTEVIKAEYQIVFQHLFWHRYNTLINKSEAITTFDDTMNKNIDVLSNCLNKSGGKSYLINIPMHLSNIELKEQISSELKKLALL